MGRLKKRIPLEVDEDLADAISAGLAAEESKLASQGHSAGLTKNEFLRKIIRRGLSADLQVKEFTFARVDDFKFAEFRGDILRLQHLMVQVRKAFTGRNRWVDSDDPESVRRYEEDNRATKEFLRQCDSLLHLANNLAWALHGIDPEDANFLREALMPSWKLDFEQASKQLADLDSQMVTEPENMRLRAIYASLNDTTRRTSILLKLAESVLLKT